ncbi:hypothetical protein NKR19_g10338 [Coniochaeta hoffmannii]|uniref:Fungal N-terminal domain-containing protein n=1 Tax=Coniochaeta hoffmannii TaxID=91930 RepID=A0AA38RDV7_9PEZI|nr:hypothetical protein NKR19_g10338 [Coniochaeta hoffmannii]
MDPFSITVGCIALSGTIGKTVARLHEFITNLRDARPELMKVQVRLHEWKLIIDILERDYGPTTTSADVVPDSANHVLYHHINSCMDTLEQLNRLIETFEGGMGRARWAVAGRKAVETLREELDGNLQHIKLVLGISTRYDEPIL